eukprot:CAMPEP_0181531820 /NCGR_PEP_ID=MMETSP1110-20121109/72299_1 /TAXON_ID=174948 /ORGANISM="Symbiodinium sp., Strain CCMP421" /LENGTH=38 /DNA_ID= /DNA_START= /DNA_END= /DNA_ORIENTATION=
MGVAAMFAIHCPAFTKRPPNAAKRFPKKGATILSAGSY